MHTITIPILIRIECDGHPTHYVLSPESGGFTPLNESHLSKAIPGYKMMNEKGRAKEFAKFIQNADIIQTFKINSFLPNAPDNPEWEDLPPEEQRAAMKAIFSVGRLFKELTAGHRLISDTLCAMHMDALRKAEPCFSAAISIKSKVPEMATILATLVSAAVPLEKWKLIWKKKHADIRRNAVLDFRTNTDRLPHHFQDFSQLKVCIKGYKSLKVPFAYQDTIVLMIGADKAQIKEAAPYLENAAVILLNSDAGEMAPTKLAAADLAAYAPDVVTQLDMHCEQIAALLRWWWSWYGCKKEYRRAERITREARASFGKPDSRYVRVELDPKKLRDAIRYRVLLSFLDELESCGPMSAEEIAPYRQAAKDVFDPAPAEPVTVRRVEDPEVFLEIMRKLVNEKAASLVPDNERFVKGDKSLGAWRTISGERYLVMEEATWAKRPMPRRSAAGRIWSQPSLSRRTGRRNYRRSSLSRSSLRPPALATAIVTISTEMAPVTRPM